MKLSSRKSKKINLLHSFEDIKIFKRFLPQKNMELRKSWNTVPFDLELIVNFNYNGMNKEESRKFNALVEDARRRIAESYPKMELHESTTIMGHYGGKYRGPALHGKTDIKTFKETFGNNIKRGISLVFPPDSNSDYLCKMVSDRESKHSRSFKRGYQRSIS
jgi:hypothetical protein